MAKKGESDFLRHLKFDVLGHVIDALLNCVVRETYLIKLVDTVLIEDKTSSLYHARFNKRLSNRVCLLLRDKKEDLLQGLDDLAVLKENSCSMIQSRPLELVFFDFEVGQILAGQFRMNFGEVLLQLEGLHALVSKCLLADDALWQLHAIVHDR